MAKKLMMIFTNEEMSRITFVSENNILVDMHGLNKRQMTVFLRNLSAMYKDAVDIVIIHGYNHGTALKECISADNGLIRREHTIEPCNYNIGRTILHLM